VTITTAAPAGKRRQQLEAGALREPQIEKHNIGHSGGKDRSRRVEIADVAHNCHVGFTLEQPHQIPARRRLVVDD
jgi:hypothetical protein